MRRALLALVLVLPSALSTAEDKPFDLGDLLDRMSEGGKKRFLYDQSVSARFRDEQVRMTSKVSEIDASFALGLELLKTAGLAAVEIEGNTVPTYRVVLLSEAGTQALRTFTSAEQLPSVSEFCALEVTLKNVPVRELLSPLQSMLSDSRHVWATDSANVLRMTDYGPVLKKAAEFVKRVDAPQGAPVMWRVTLAAVESVEGTDGETPERFRDAGLEKATGKKQFRLLGEGCVVVSMGGVVTRGQSTGRLETRIAGALGADVTMTVSREAEGPPALEPIDVRVAEDPQSSVAGGRTSCRAALKEGSWVIVGTLPAHRADTAIVLLARADRSE